MPKAIKKTTPLYHKAYEEIKAAILTGRISPGSKISESTFADQLKISRTPLRDALRQLKKDGLLTTENGVTKVMELNQQDYEDLYDCRIQLEKRAVELTINRMTENQIKAISLSIKNAEQALFQGDYMKTLTYNTQFHKELTSPCPNRRLLRLLDQIRSLLLLYRANSLQFSEHNIEIFSEHRMILEAVKRRDAAKAVEAIEAHLLGDLARGKNMFKQQNDFVE